MKNLLQGIALEAAWRVHQMRCPEDYPNPLSEMSARMLFAMQGFRIAMEKAGVAARLMMP